MDWIYSTKRMMMLETTATAVQNGTNKNLSGYRAALFVRVSFV